MKRRTMIRIFSRCMDWAVLYLRIFLGSALLLHNIGKMQRYNEIIESYPAILGITPVVAFVLTTIVESLLAVLLIMGIWVRISALLLSVGAIYMLCTEWNGAQTILAYMAICVFLVISGGGLYSFDAAMRAFPTKN